MPFCSACGAPAGAGDRFCTACGAPLRSALPPEPPAAAIPPAASTSPGRETARVILPGLRESRLLGQDLFTLVVTDRRCIFARLAPGLLKEATRVANEQAKGEGKGFLARWGAQLEATQQYHLRYQEMDPDRILAEAEGNFALELSTLAGVDVRQVSRSQRRGQKTRAVAAWQVTFVAAGGSRQFETDQDPAPLLRQALGGLVR